MLKGIRPIRDLAFLIQKAVGVDCEIEFDVSRQDGAKMKTIDGQTGARALSWSPEIEIEDGIAETVEWYENMLTGQ